MPASRIWVYQTTVKTQGSKDPGAAGPEELIKELISRRLKSLLESVSVSCRRVTS